MFMLKFTFILLNFFTVFTFAQSGWVLQTVNTEYNINYLSYKDTAICQLASKYVGSHAPQFFISTNGTATWHQNYLFAFGYDDIQFLNAYTGFLMDYQTNQITIRRSNNSGLSWSTIHTFYTGTGTFENLYFIDMQTGYLWGNTVL